jgi:uncharacterized protein (DUF58 family)
MRPARGQIVGWSTLAAGSVLCVIVPELLPFWWIGLAIHLLVLLISAWIALRRSVPEVARMCPARLAHRVETTVEIKLTSTESPTLQVSVFDHHPLRLRAEGLPITATLAPQAAAVVRYRLIPTTRGQHQFGPVELLITAPLRLWRRRVKIACDQSVRVYPNFAAVSQYRLLAAANRAGQLGIRRRRRRGEGTELHQLRDYHVGDTLRQIDWKATARRARAISREYEVERDQSVLFLLDCGRRMRAEDRTGSHLDHALNAVLLLAYVALRQGDAVGLLTFGSRERFLAPVKGRLAMRAILNAVFDLESSTAAPDYTQAAESLTRLHHRRALVLAITNLRDEDEGDLIPAMTLLQRRHLVVLASLREQILDETLAGEVQNLDDALLVSATHQYLSERRRLHQRLTGRGLQWLDTSPRELPIRLVNRYLEIKSGGAL